jgi:hypothetical protein
MRDGIAVALFMLGLVVLSVGVNPLSPVVQQVRTQRAAGQGSWLWPISIAGIGLALMGIAALVR